MIKRKRPPSKKMQAALADHAKFLRKLGVDPDRKPQLRGAVDNPLHAAGGERTKPHVATSDLVPGSGHVRKANPVCQLPVAQVYHKGPVMVVTDMSELDGSKRRN